MEVVDGVMEEGGIDGSEAGGIFEQDIAGVLTFAHGPVVGAQVKALGIDARVKGFGQVSQPGDPPASDEAVYEDLCPGDVGDVNEAVVPLFERDAFFLHAASEPFPAVDADLDGEGDPGLQAHVHEPELTVEEVEVDVETGAIGRFESENVVAAEEAEGSADFDASEDTDESFADLVFFDDLASDLFLGSAGGGDVLVGTAMSFGIGFGAAADAFGQGFCEGGEVGQEDPPAGEPAFDTAAVADGT